MLKQFRKFAICILCLFCALVSSVESWWDIPHMIIVQIAKDQSGPLVVSRAETIIQYFEADFPQSSTLVTAGCFADDLTPLGLSGFKVWHGVLTPYNVDGFLTQPEIDRIESLVHDNNLHSAIRQSLSTLKDPSASPWQKSFMLRFLLHCVGDIHQPLHCIQLYSKEFPAGDLAGHRFQLSGVPYRNLHTLWDAALGFGAGRMSRPLNGDDNAKICALAQEIVSLYPPETLPEKDNMDMFSWSAESYRLAIDVAYTGIAPNEQPSESYLQKGRDTALRQIALAGYRLANLLQDLFGEDSDEV